MKGEVMVNERYSFKLFIAGAKPQSSRAVSNLKRLCELYLAGNYDLEVIDIYQDPRQAAEDEILAVPTLVKLGPGERRKLIGDLSDEARVLTSLGVARDASKGDPV